MELPHTDPARILSQLSRQLQAGFDGPWLLYPGADHVKPLPVTQAQRDQLFRRHTAHRCGMLEFCCVLDGEMLLMVEDDLLCLRPEQLFLIPSGVLHNELPGDRPYTAVWFVFFRDGIHVNISGVCPDGTFQVFHGQRILLDPVVINLLLGDITKELTSSLPGAGTLVKCSLLQLMILLIRQLEKLGAQLTPEQWRQSVVREVAAHLQENPGMMPDLGELADRCALSPNHLSSIFKTVTGKTISAYCTELRIDRARHLLRTTPLKLRQIAELLGYYDQYHFCKAFKKATGLSPSAYRAEENGK